MNFANWLREYHKTTGAGELPPNVYVVAQAAFNAGQAGALNKKCVKHILDIHDQGRVDRLLGERDYKALWEFLTEMIYDNNEELRQAIESKLTIDTTPEQFTEIVVGVMRAKL